MTKKRGFFLLLVFLPVMSVAMAGVNGNAIFVYACVASMFLIAWYFWSKRFSPTPSRTERSFAHAWLFIRRLVGFFGALIFILLSIALLIGDLSLEKRIGGAVFTLFLSLISAWTAIYGSGPNRADLKDDVKLHEENKKRYGWRW